MEVEYLTKEKHESLTKELEFLRTKKRKEIASLLEYAKSLGDLSENAEYHEAREAQAVLEDRIHKLEQILKSASIVSAHETGMVVVGSILTIERVTDKLKREITIVGSEEADAARNMISMKSPLGSHALGKQKGDTFSFETPSGTISYKIIEIK